MQNSEIWIKFCTTPFSWRVFLHHPSAAGNQLLTELDTAIQQTQNLPEGKSKRQAIGSLKDAYRNVLARTYAQNKITGETLSYSQQSNPYLFGVPLRIAALVLVVMPALFLLKVVSEQALLPAVLPDFQLLIRGVMAFVWGCVSGLSFIAILITRLVRGGTYQPCLVKGTGMTWALGGICGMMSFIVLHYLSPLTGVMVDYALGAGAFILGLLVAKAVNMTISKYSNLNQKPLQS